MRPPGVVSKLVSFDVLVTACQQLHAQAQQLVFTNGCFDLLHPGHIHCLEHAKSFGQTLIVAMNSDQSVHRLKGEGRPVWNADQRAIMISSLPAVDFVVEFEEDTPLKLIETVQPQVLVKGGDYQPQEVVGYDLIQQWGGRVEIVDLVGDVSTTRIIASWGSLDQHAQ